MVCVQASIYSRFVFNLKKEDFLSPAILYENGMYKMWSINHKSHYDIEYRYIVARNHAYAHRTGFFVYSAVEKVVFIISVKQAGAVKSMILNTVKARTESYGAKNVKLNLNMKILNTLTGTLMLFILQRDILYRIHNHQELLQEGFQSSWEPPSVLNHC